MKNRFKISQHVNLLHQILKSQTEEARQLLRQVQPGYQQEIQQEPLETEPVRKFSNSNTLPLIDVPKKRIDGDKNTNASNEISLRKITSNKRKQAIKEQFLEQMEKNADYKALEFIRKLNQDRKKNEQRFIKARQRQSDSRNGKKETVKAAIAQQIIHERPIIRKRIQPGGIRTKSVNSNKSDAVMQNKSQKTWIHLYIREMLFEIVNNIVRKSYQSKQINGDVKLDLSKHRYFKSKFRIEIEEKQKEVRQKRYRSLASKPSSVSESISQISKKKSSDYAVQSSEKQNLGLHSQKIQENNEKNQAEKEEIGRQQQMNTEVISNNSAIDQTMLLQCKQEAQITINQNQQNLQQPNEKDNEQKQKVQNDQEIQQKEIPAIDTQKVQTQQNKQESANESSVKDSGRESSQKDQQT